MTINKSEIHTFKEPPEDGRDVFLIFSDGLCGCGHYNTMTGGWVESITENEIDENIESHVRYWVDIPKYLHETFKPDLFEKWYLRDEWRDAHDDST